jgi:hypothetical protein
VNNHQTDGASLFNEGGGRKLAVVRAKFLETFSADWDELFHSYDTLRAVTYSSSIGFVCEVLQHFRNAEIIFGFNKVVSGEMREVIAHQMCSLRLFDGEISNESKEYLVSRIEDRSLRLFISHEEPSHEKVFLLEANDGRRRVVEGSANMSYSAFTGKQRENITVFDDDEAFDHYYSSFESLKAASLDEIIIPKALFSGGNNLEDLPIARMLKSGRVIMFEPARKADPETSFALAVHKEAEKLKPFMPPPDKKGFVLLSAKEITHIKHRVAEDGAREKASRREYPELVVAIDGGTASLNGEPLDLNPEQEAVSRDVRLFLEYMAGFEAFYGDAPDLQQKYYNFANWFFLSPFIAPVRVAAALSSQPLIPYPMFGIIYGQSNAGKTHFLETLLKMMIGSFSAISGADCSRTVVDAARRTAKGAPLVIDDIKQARFREHAVEIIKTDNFGVAERLETFPAVVFSANEDIKSAQPEIIKRAVVCRPRASFSQEDAKNSVIVQKTQKNIGTAFYREYLRRMFAEMPEITRELKLEYHVPSFDMFTVSSRVIRAIIAEHAAPPFFVRELSFFDYFGAKAVGSYVIKVIRGAWESNRNIFRVKEKSGELHYRAEDRYAAAHIFNELPVDVKESISHENVIMRLDAARRFFGVNFKKGWF